MWVAAIDFKKAFDSINHDKLWQTLKEQHVPSAYIKLLQELYAQQDATVKTDQHSRRFNIKRGVKQGDPLSSLLFNALLEHMFKRLKLRWTTDRFGIQLAHAANTRLTNLRFADDVLLIGRTKAAITLMLTDVYDLALDYGLELHPDKTYILYNDSKGTNRTSRAPVNIRGHTVQVLPFDSSTKYLGRLFTFNDYHTTEVHNRIACAWRKFHALRNELTSRRYPLRTRLRLFDGTITPTVLYACTSWTLTDDLATTLQRTQRRMLRLIVGTPRRNHQPSRCTNEQATMHPSATTGTHELLADTNKDDLEPWVDFIKRATHIAEATISKQNISQWTTAYLRRKWRWAQRLTTVPDNRWCRLITKWKPTTTEHRPVYRRQGRPRKRWRDDIDDYFDKIGTNNWYETGKAVCRQHEEKFIKLQKAKDDE